MLKGWFIFWAVCISSFSSFCQIVFEQGIIKGGITGAGFSTGLGFGSGNLNIHIEPNSEVKKAYMFFYSMRNPPQTTYLINSISVNTSECTLVSEVNYNNPPSTNVSPVRIFYKDISNIIENDNSDVSIVIPNQLDLNPNEGFWSVYVVVIYSNANLANLNYTIILNNQNLTGFENYSISNLNTLSTDKPIGLALYTDRYTPFQSASSNIYIDGTFLGNLYGHDFINSDFHASGVKGHFYYQNEQLFGLDDDVPNAQMNQSDALADISSFLTNGITSLDFSISHINYPDQPVSQNRINLAYFLTYTSPCQPFNATLLTSDTTTCANIPVQLGASGGYTSGAFQAYEWLPQQNLSCYDCPNPIFLGDSTTNYTVRIRNTDSCSVVYPVRVRVLPNPSFESFEISESICGGATGSIAVASSGLSQPHSYLINDGLPQNNGTFNNLAAGEYTITVANTNGCSVDSTVFVGEFNNVQAAFSVNPTTGTAPLDISITNQSQNASEYFWDFSNQDGAPIYQGNGSLSGVEAPLAGLYTLTLVAGNGAPHCNDTTSALIVVKEPFVVFAYTHVTNEANLYQVFFSGVSEYDYKIYALDGKLVYEKSGNLEAAGHVDLWEISKFSSGMYVFRIKVKDLDSKEHEVDGKLVVVR